MQRPGWPKTITHQSGPSTRAGSLRSSPSDSPTASAAPAGSWQRSQPVVTCSTHTHTHTSRNISEPNVITAANIDITRETQMADVIGMCSKKPGPNERPLKVISLDAISLLNVCRQRSETTLLRTLRLLYILQWMRLRAILHQVCSVSFTAFTNVCLHFCHRCIGTWNWNGVWIPEEFTIWSEIECDILALWHKTKPSNFTFGLYHLFWEASNDCRRHMQDHKR